MYGAAESSSTGAHNSRAHYQDLSREHDRLRTLFDITNALVSKLGRDELFDAISEQISSVIRHDYALLTLCTETGGLEVFALHCTRSQLLDLLKGPLEPEAMPSSKVPATGKAVWFATPISTAFRIRVLRGVWNWGSSPLASFL